MWNRNELRLDIFFVWKPVVKDREFLGTGGRSSGVAAPEEERVQASLKLLQRLKKSPGVGDLSRKWEQLAVHLIRFANEPPADAKVEL